MKVFITFALALSFQAHASFIENKLVENAQDSIKEFNDLCLRKNVSVHGKRANLLEYLDRAEGVVKKANYVGLVKSKKQFFTQIKLARNFVKTGQYFKAKQVGDRAINELETIKEN